MIFLHTSDWHIGHKLVGRDRDEEFLIVFEQLIQTIQEHHVDVLVVSGDIFDVAYPTTQAQRMYYQLLFRLQATGLKKIIIIGGNHDSISTLHAPRELLQMFEIHVVADLYDNHADQILTYAPDGITEAVFLAVPFLRDRHLRKANAGETIAERTESYLQGFIDLYKNLSQLTDKFKDNNIPVIATGHFAAKGGLVSDTERDIMVGTLNMIPIDDFVEKFDYLALGHLHKHQKIGTKGNCYYPGSLLPMSFTENGNHHFFIVGQTSPGQAVKLSFLPIKQPRELISLKGDILQIEEKLNMYSNTENQLAPWFDLVIKLPSDSPSLIMDAEQWLKNFETHTILKYKFEFDQKSNSSVVWTNKNLTELSVQDIFNNLLTERHVENETEEIKEMFDSLYQEILQSKQT